METSMVVVTRIEKSVTPFAVVAEDDIPAKRDIAGLVC